MTLLIAVALVASSATSAVQAAPAAAQAAHAQHGPGTKPQGEGCSCKKMAEGGKMACCAEHDEGHGGEHAEHGATR